MPWHAAMNTPAKAAVHPTTALSLDESSRSATVDACRGFAALLVYFGHTGTALVLPPLVLHGDSGVHLFFVLSGYLLYGPFAKALIESVALPSIGRFYARRFLRIWPPFAVALVVSSVARYLLRSNPPSVGLILEHALFVTNYDFRAGVPVFYRINAVFWTLAVEAQFYLLLPLLAFRARALSPVRPLFAACLPVALCIAIGPCARAVEFAFTDAGTATRFRTLPSFLDLFGWGMAVAVLEISVGRWLRAHKTLVASLVGFGLALVLAANNYREVVGAGWLAGDSLLYTLAFPLLIGVGFAVMLFALTNRDWGRLASRFRAPFAAVGTISYSLYLHHLLVQQFLFRVVPLPDIHFYLRGFLAGLVFLPLTLAVSAAAYFLIERPSHRYAQSLRGTAMQRHLSGAFAR
jgi:peptidoglycan/LPS O-acetylase OafA/YrhL